MAKLAIAIKELGIDADAKVMLHIEGKTQYPIYKVEDIPRKYHARDCVSIKKENEEARYLFVLQEKRNRRKEK